MSFITRWTYHTRNLLFIIIYTSFYHFFFVENYFNIFVRIFSKCQFKSFPPVYLCRWTCPPIHANQNNHTKWKNKVLVLKLFKSTKYSFFLNVCCVMMLYVFCVVLCVSFCTGHFVMVPSNLTYLHCLQHSFFEHLFKLY